MVLLPRIWTWSAWIEAKSPPNDAHAGVAAAMSNTPAITSLAPITNLSAITSLFNPIEPSCPLVIKVPLDCSFGQQTGGNRDSCQGVPSGMPKLLQNQTPSGAGFQNRPSPGAVSPEIRLGLPRRGLLGS